MDLFDLVLEFRDDLGRQSEVTWWDYNKGCTIYIYDVRDKDYYTTMDFIEELKDMGYGVEIKQEVDDYDALDALEIDIYSR